MQWSYKARELMRNQCIDFSIYLQENIYSTLDKINRKRIDQGLDPLKRITKEVVEQTILNVINDTPPGGDIENRKIENIAETEVYQ